MLLTSVGNLTISNFLKKKDFKYTNVHLFYLNLICVISFISHNSNLMNFDIVALTESFFCFYKSKDWSLCKNHFKGAWPKMTPSRYEVRTNGRAHNDVVKS